MEQLVKWDELTADEKIIASSLYRQILEEEMDGDAEAYSLGDMANVKRCKFIRHKYRNYTKIDLIV